MTITELSLNVGRVLGTRDARFPVRLRDVCLPFPGSSIAPARLIAVHPSERRNQRSKNHTCERRSSPTTKLRRSRTGPH
ncbi:hypothetical protein GY45DRAFT_562290 [Cubamyces sp. BRFM 1775]|nr:hypothetical protein GY45DRAFT_562290 [Cubamyces sp. BRFM 1775]